MGKFLKIYNLPKLNQVESENLKIQITLSETEAVIKNLLKNKSPNRRPSQVNFTRHFKKNKHLSFSKYFKKFKRREVSQAYFMRPA